MSVSVPASVLDDNGDRHGRILSFSLALLTGRTSTPAPAPAPAPTPVPVPVPVRVDDPEADSERK